MAIVLYIDTDQLYMSAMKLLLEQNGFKVLLARTREHMREVLLVNVVDLALVDHNFAHEHPHVLAEIGSLSPTTKTLLLGMRDSEGRNHDADAFCARLSGPEKLIAEISATIAKGNRQTAHRA